MKHKALHRTLTALNPDSANDLLQERGWAL